MEHLYVLYYRYFPRFMTELYEHRFCKEGDPIPDFDQPPKPGDFLLEVRFFNFFGIPVFIRYRRYEAKVTNET